jgi:hypothetical protein
MSRISTLLRELADEFERHETPPPEPSAEPKAKRRRVHEYVPKHKLTDDDLRAARQRATRRGIPT